MKKMAMTMAMILAGLMAAVSADADCTFSGRRNIQIYNGYSRPITLLYHCTADGIDTIDDLVISGMTGQLQHIAVVPTSGHEPTSVTPDLKTIDNNPAYAAEAITTPWTRQDLEPPVGFSSGLVVDQTATCDATDEWDIALTFL